MKEQIKARTKAISINVLRLIKKLDKNDENRILKNQIGRAACSVGANYRAAIRAKSNADYINKLKIVEEETDEVMFFLELIHEFNPEFSDEIKNIYVESEEILKIIVATLKTLRTKK